jgi:hypothetical protein
VGQKRSNDFFHRINFAHDCALTTLGGLSQGRMVSTVRFARDDCLPRRLLRCWFAKVIFFISAATP